MKLSLRKHPDKLGALEPAAREVAVAKFTEIKEAYEVLYDEEDRALYDACYVSADGGSDV